MELDSRQVLRILQKKGVRSLHHATTLTTACTYLRAGALMSHESVEQRGLERTAQKSDQKDKQLGIFNDIFLDMVDIHASRHARNRYGPVLFMIDLHVLDDSIGPVWLTRKNPVNWVNGEKTSDRYFSSVNEFRASYTVGDLGAMIMLRAMNGILLLSGILRGIIVDELDAAFDIGGRTMKATDYAIGVLKAAAGESGLEGIPIERRKCKRWCRCHDVYKRNAALVGEVFALPEDDIKIS